MIYGKRKIDKKARLNEKGKIIYIDERKDFNSLTEDFLELKKLVEKGKLTSVFIMYRYKEKGDFKTGYMWRGREALTKALGLIEYIEMYMYELNCMH